MCIALFENDVHDNMFLSADCVWFSWQKIAAVIVARSYWKAASINNKINTTQKQVMP